MLLSLFQSIHVRVAFRYGHFLDRARVVTEDSLSLSLRNPSSTSQLLKLETDFFPRLFSPVQCPWNPIFPSQFQYPVARGVQISVPVEELGFLKFQGVSLVVEFSWIAKTVRTFACFSMLLHLLY